MLRGGIDGFPTNVIVGNERQLDIQFLNQLLYAIYHIGD